MQHVHVQVKSDNTCTVSYINSMGGIKSVECNELALRIWFWCIERHIWLSATHIPGIDNDADFSSRNFNENVEWMLNHDIFLKITDIWGIPELDMFASRLNKQLERYVSWRPDPEALSVNAFSRSWTDIYMYAFPPFSLVTRVMQKIRRDEAECILVIPIWPTQNWFTLVIESLIDHPIIIPIQKDNLTIVNTNKVHPLIDKLQLMACRLSGKRCKVEIFLNKQPKSLWHLGDVQQRNNIVHILKNGFSTVIKGRQIVFKLL